MEEVVASGYFPSFSARLAVSGCVISRKILHTRPIKVAISESKKEWLIKQEVMHDDER